MVSRNAPLLRIYARPSRSNWIAVRLEDDGVTVAREAVGSKVTVVCGSLRATTHRQIGEGLGAQNSATLAIPLGGCESVDDVVVTWPNGRVDSYGPLRTREHHRLSPRGPPL